MTTPSIKNIFLILICLFTFSGLLFLALKLYGIKKIASQKENSVQNTIKQNTIKPEQVRGLLQNLNELNAPETSLEKKIQILKEFKTISLDQTLDKKIRLVAGEQVTASFFNHGMSLGSSFSSSTTDPLLIEREVYAYAKYLNTLGATPLNSLLTAYIGLRFYPDEMSKDIVSNLLKSSIESSGSAQPRCSTLSKRASVIYLASKNIRTDVSEEFGNYYANFEKAFEICKDQKNSLVAFMWLAAISDIGDSKEELQKANELVTLITKDTSDANPLVSNLKKSYFPENKEPDTVSIVERLRSKYPKFDTFIKSIK